MAGLLASLTGAGAAAGGGLGGIGSAIGAIGSIAGAAIGAAGAQAQADAQARAAEHQAAQYEVKAKQEQAQAWWQAREQKRRKNLLLGRLQAQAAASGFDATSPDIVGLGGIGSEIVKYGTLNQMMAISGGQTRAAGYMDAANAAYAEADDARRAGSIAAASSIIGGIVGMGKYMTGGSYGYTPHYS
jgi:hypothetical protein